ncbi:MAG: 5'/3'-nucleotidase SurE [Fibrobacteria bacterium]|nr:5'/3'-nucleotidase SurE [Fibrobacteria bacterium]
MKILITNDDGCQSTFIIPLIEELGHEHELFLVVPDSEQSAISQAITINSSLRYEPLTGKPFPAFQVAGSPSDCVKLAVCHLFKDVSFDLVVSGINPGENAGLSSLYSGTVAGAREGATWGIPSVSLSIWDKSLVHTKNAAKWFSQILDIPGLFNFAPGTFWNVNFPDCEPSAICGTRVCNMSTAIFDDEYIEHKTVRGHSEYWLYGFKDKSQFLPEADDLGLDQHYITITPLQVDQTCQSETTRLQQYTQQLTR